MFKCFECKSEFETVKDLSHHIRTSCYLCRNKTIFSCGQEGCLRHFSGMASLKKHLNNTHSCRVQIEFGNASSSVGQEISTNIPIESSLSPENFQPICNNESTEVPEHFSAFEVISTDLLLFITYDKLLAPFPNAINVLPNLTTYVTARSSLD